MVYGLWSIYGLRAMSIDYGHGLWFMVYGILSMVRLWSMVYGIWSMVMVRLISATGWVITGHLARGVDKWFFSVAGLLGHPVPSQICRAFAGHIDRG